MYKHLNRTITLIGILFLFLYLMLSYYSRLATDDYYFIGDIKKHGMFEQVLFQYMNWTGRYSATTAANIFYNLFGLNQSYYFFLPVVSLILLIIGIRLFVLQLFRVFNSEPSLVSASLIAVLFSGLLFFMSFDIGESWFWYCGYSSYLWSIIALVWALYFLLSTNPISIVGAIFCFIYIGGASELYAAIIGLCYTFILLYSIFTKKGLWNNKHLLKKMFTVYLFFALAFIVLLIAPGNYLRDGLFPEHQLGKAFIITAKSIIKLFVFYLPSKLIYIIGFAGLFYSFGRVYSSKININKSFSSIFKSATIIVGALLLIFYFLVAYVMVETGPARVLFLASFLISVYIVFLSFIGGTKKIVETQNRTIYIASATLLVLTLLFTIFNNYFIASRYATAHDERTVTLEKLKSSITTNTLLWLKPLPPSGMLYSAEITADTTHFTNREVKMGFDLKFNVAVEKP